MSLIQEGIKRKLISTIEENGEVRQVIYLHQNKKRSYANPEEKSTVRSFS